MFQASDTLTWTRGRAPAQGGLRRTLDVAGCVPRRAVARLHPVLRSVSADRQRARRSAARRARAHRRRASRQPGAAAHRRATRSSCRTAGACRPISASRRACATTTSSRRSIATIVRRCTTRFRDRSCRSAPPGVPRGGFTADRNNFGPRLGVAWSPFGSTTTVVRGGYGLIYSQPSLAQFEGLYFSPPYYNFNYYFSLSAAAPLDALRSVPGELPVPDAAVGAGLPRRHAHAVPASVQRERAARARIVAHGRRRLRRLARPQPARRPRLQPAARRARCRTTCGPTRASATSSSSSRAPQSNYNALAASLAAARDVGAVGARRLHARKSEDDASSWFPSAGDPNFPQDSNNPAAEWGRSNFDVRHRLSVSASYDLPFGRSADRGLARGVAARRLAGQRHPHAAKRPAVHRGAAARSSTTATPAAPTSGSAPTIGRT